MREYLRKNGWIISAMFVTVAVGIVAVLWNERLIEKKLSEILLHQAQFVTQAINPAQLEKLSGSSADLSSEDYLQIKQSLARMKTVNNDCHFLYIMGQRETGEVFFFADSLSPDSKDYAPPGLVYEEISLEYMKAFHDKQALIVGPITDRWGTLVSALVPIINPQSGKLIAVLGMDIDAKTWKWQIVRQSILPSLMTLIILMLIIVEAALIRSNRTIKTKQAQLNESRDMLTSAIAQSPAGILIADAPDLKLRLGNQALLAKSDGDKTIFTDIEFDELLTHWKLYYPDGKEYPRKEIPLVRTVLSGEVIREEEMLVKTPQGDERYVLANSAPVRDINGNITAAIGVFQNISQRKELENKKALFEEQIRQSQKMESIGRLAGGVAHDFNNLLTAIQGFSDLVQSSLSPDDPIKQDVSEIQKAAESAAALTNQLLAFSRKQIISPKVLDINKVISQSERMLRRIIGEDIDFVFSSNENIGKVLVDTGQIDQILINLGVNARDAMPDGGKLTIETAGVSLDEKKCQSCGNPIVGDFVMFAVSDNGIGMQAETMQNIFEPFFTTKERGKGTGLGLSTIHGIVHQNKGHINVYSEPGKGTTFKIYFPVVQDEAESIQEHDATVDTRGSETILLVEDQDLVRKLAARTLRSKGYHIIEAENGGDASVKFENHGKQINLLLTDVIMPSMGGKELYERLIKINSDLKTLFMSGYPKDAISHHGVLDEGTNFIQKPFKPNELAAKVRQVLNG